MLIVTQDRPQTVLSSKHTNMSEFRTLIKHSCGIGRQRKLPVDYIIHAAE